MTNPELIINPELRDLLPPLDAEELAGLEESILQDGCTDKLIVWGNILVDGHHRHAICTKHKISFKVKQRDFKNLEDVKLWMWKHQESRRNLTLFQRAEIALKMKSVLVVQAKERQRGGQGGILLSQNSGQANGKTERELARRAGLSHDTIRKTEFLLDHADEETKARLRSTKKETSIHKEFTRLKAEFEAKQPEKPKKTKAPASSSATKKATAKKPTNVSSQSMFPDTVDTVETDPTVERPTEIGPRWKGVKEHQTYSCGVRFEPDPDDDVFDWITREERDELREDQKASPALRLVPLIRNYTIQSIPEHDPEYLVSCLFSLFQPLYHEKLLYALARKMFAKGATEIVRKFLVTLTNECQS